jgi:hypothetical protein
MGITVTSTLEVPGNNGIVLENFYINIKEIIISGVSNIAYIYQIYFTQAARNNNKLFISRIAVDIPITEVPPDIYSLVYNNLKTLYPNFVDC